MSIYFINKNIVIKKFLVIFICLNFYIIKKILTLSHLISSLVQISKYNEKINFFTIEVVEIDYWLKTLYKKTKYKLKNVLNKF